MNEYNESLKNNRKFALQVKKTYDTICRNLSSKARLGSIQSAKLLMEKMSEQNVVLYHLGFTVGDTGRLRKRK